jgi:hypothetical protein
LCPATSSRMRNRCGKGYPAEENTSWADRDVEMAAGILYFCTPSEELDVLRYVLSTGEVLAFDRNIASPQVLPTIDALSPPTWPAQFECFLWLRSSGPLEWHLSKPAALGETHGDLVHAVVTRLNWEANPPPAGMAVLDTNRSPVLRYRRGPIAHMSPHPPYFSVPRGPDGTKMGPCELASMSSAPERVSSEFASWVRRCFSWIRRHSTRIQCGQSRHPTVPNPLSIMNSVYAFPGALAELDSGEHEFAVIPP